MLIARAYDGKVRFGNVVHEEMVDSKFQGCVRERFGRGREGFRSERIIGRAAILGFLFAISIQGRLIDALATWKQARQPHDTVGERIDELRGYILLWVLPVTVLPLALACRWLGRFRLQLLLRLRLRQRGGRCHERSQHSSEGFVFTALERGLPPHLDKTQGTHIAFGLEYPDRQVTHVVQVPVIVVWKI